MIGKEKSVFLFLFLCILSYIHALVMLVDLLCLVTRHVIVVAAWDYIGFGCHWYLSYTFKFIGVIPFFEFIIIPPNVRWMVNCSSEHLWFKMKHREVRWKQWFWIVEDKDAICFDTTEMHEKIEGWSCDNNKIDTCREDIDDRQRKKFFFFFLCIRDVLRDFMKKATTTTMWAKLVSLYTI